MDIYTSFMQSRKVSLACLYKIPLRLDTLHDSENTKIRIYINTSIFVPNLEFALHEHNNYVVLRVIFYCIRYSSSHNCFKCVEYNHYSFKG